MTVVTVLLFLAKAVFSVGLLALNIAGLLTWADRRQGSMIQDRIGPNRAVVWLPKRIAQGAALAPALAVAAGVLALFVLTEASEEGGARTGRALLFSQLAIFATWLTALVIGGLVRRRGPRNSFDVAVRSVGDPRRFFHLGLAAHAASLLAAGLFRGTPEGRTLREVAYGASPAVLALVVVGGAVYAALNIREERVGLRLAGLLHPAADGLKTIFKEDHIPPGADRFLHSLAPWIAFFPALAVIACIPFGDTLCFGVGPNGKLDLTKLAPFVPRDGVCTEGAVALQAVDLNVGVLFFFALAGTGIVGAALAGWASDNKFSLLGGLRAASQMVSYEVTLGLTVVGAIMTYGTLRLEEMVRWQHAHAWGIFVQPLAAVLFFTAAVAESKRIPFDMPEGESEIVAGYYTEYSGMKFAMFFFAEYVAVVTSSALFVTLFLGGFGLPFLERDGLVLQIGDTVFFQQRMSHLAVVLLGVLGFVGKTVLLCWVQLTIRWTLPRFRYDQLMRLGWRKLLPASLVNILLTAVVLLLVQGASAPVQQALRVLGDLTHLLVATAGVVAVVALVRFLLAPVEKQRLLVTSAAQAAAARGGTRAAPMQA